MKLKLFSSKVLLFGEYSIIQNSMALASPYDLFEGILRFSKEEHKRTDPELKALVYYLKDLKKNKLLDFDFDITSFDFDCSQGLFFDSTIPQGFGVGSSGALTAALLFRYGNPDEFNYISTSNLKNILSLIESHFHGSSSGLDPLISFINKTILIKSSNELKVIDFPKFKDNGGAFFLLNTGRSRKTEPLVNLFLEKCKDRFFINECKNKLLPITDHCINSLLDKDLEQLFTQFGLLSSFQYEHFSPMIPNIFKSVWMDALEDKLPFKLKLCGAGGGGFLIGITKNLEQINNHLSQFEIRPLFHL